MECCKAVKKRNFNVPYKDIFLAYLRMKLDTSLTEQIISLNAVDMYAYSIMHKVINNPDIKDAYSCISFELECKDVSSMIQSLNQSVSSSKDMFRVCDNSIALLDTGLLADFLSCIELKVWEE